MNSIANSNLSVDPKFFEVLRESHERLVGSQLAPEGADAAWLYNDAPFAVLAHNTDADPLFIYANKTAQGCFGYTWDEFISLPSRLSAESAHRAERQRLFETVAARGSFLGYQGVRVTKVGLPFQIEDVIVWQLIDRSGVNWGQAAHFPRWQTLGENASDALQLS